MTKQFFTVADDFDGLLSIVDHPRPLVAGDLLVVDQDGPVLRDIYDGSPVTSDHSNATKFGTALAALVTDGSLAYCGKIANSDGSNGSAMWENTFYLPGLSDGDTFRFKPGWAGRVVGFSAASVQDATTSGKSGSFQFGILGDDLSDEINTATVASGTTPVVFVVTIDGETYTTAEVAYNASTTTVKSALVAAGIATGDVTVGGSAGAWTFTWTGDAANKDITFAILRNEIVTVVVDATGGDFDLSYVGADDPETIVANATQAAFQSAVDALLDAAGNGEAATVVRSGSANSYTYTITGHDGANLAAFSTDPTNLTGGAGTATRTVVQQGGATNVSAGTTVQGGGARIVGSSGNPATLDLTSSNVSDGGVIAGETIATGTNPKHGNFGADDEIEVTYSTSTPFVEGAVQVVVYLQRTA